MDASNEAIASLRFAPWVGAEYWSATAPWGFRLMVLGESSYWTEPLPRDAIPALVTANVDGTAPVPYLDSIAAVALGLDADIASRRAVWKHVVFQNFLQEQLLEPRALPENVDWDLAKQAFLAQLAHFRPHAVLCTGIRLYSSWLPGRIGRAGPTLQLEDGKYPSWIYPAGDFDALTFYIRHPSAQGFRRSTWARVVAAWLAATREYHAGRA